MKTKKIVRDADPKLYPCSRMGCGRESDTVTVSVTTGAVDGWCVTHALSVLFPQLAA